jgi:hypothetical protein
MLAAATAAWISIRRMYPARLDLADDRTAAMGSAFAEVMRFRHYP